MKSKNDAELVDLARSGNRDAYGELIRRYQRSIWGLACLLVNDRYEAQDLTQEAFLRAWLNLDLLSDPAKFAPWLRRIVFGVSIDWLRVFRPDLYRLPDVKTELELSGQSAHSESALEKLQAIEMRSADLGRRRAPASAIPPAVDALSPRWSQPQQGRRSPWRTGEHGAIAGDTRAAETATDAGCLCCGSPSGIGRHIQRTDHWRMVHVAYHGW